MRTTTSGGVTLQYPDEIGFCFNPCLFVLNGANIASVAFSITDGTTTKEVEFDAFDGQLYADIREFVQTLYDEDIFSNDIDYSATVSESQLGKDVTIAVTAYNGGTAIATFSVSVFYVWGAVNPNGVDVWNGQRRVKWFTNYPFTVGLYAAEATNLIVGNTHVINIPSAGLYNVQPTYNGEARRIRIDNYDGTVTQATFDDTFDLTFWSGDGTQTMLFDIDVDRDADEGYYLRWIDRHGFWAYWLFKVGAEQFQIADGGEYMRNNLLAYDQTYGYQGGAGRRQGYTRQDVVPLCAPLVERDMWDYLLDIVTSPVVDLFRGYSGSTPKWQSVTVQAGSYTKAMRLPLQDFALNILLPEVPTQTL